MPSVLLIVKGILRHVGAVAAGACARSPRRYSLAGAGLAAGCPPLSRETPLDNAAELDDFLRGVERRAFVMALAMTGDREEALDVVQDAMLRFVRRYRKRPVSEWRPLLFAIVANRARDWQRHQVVRNRVLALFRRVDEPDPVDEAPAPPGNDPEGILVAAQALDRLGAAVRKLPARQQQAFALRCLEELDVAQTARAMGCSQGSVKTHYSRALGALRRALEVEET